MWVRGQIVGVSCLFTPCGVWRFISELSHLPGYRRPSYRLADYMPVLLYKGTEHPADRIKTSSS